MDPIELGPSLELTLSGSSHPSSPPIPHRLFTCNFCRRKYYSSQALGLGGHQNAHKVERSIIRRTRQRGSIHFDPHAVNGGLLEEKTSLVEGSLGNVQSHAGILIFHVTREEESADSTPPVSVQSNKKHYNGGLDLSLRL